MGPMRDRVAGFDAEVEIHDRLSGLFALCVARRPLVCAFDVDVRLWRTFSFS